jgi:hypothetical protein
MERETPFPSCLTLDKIRPVPMEILFYTLPCSGTLLEALVLWRLSKRRLWCRYPYLTAFVLYTFLRDAILFPINRYRPDEFAEVYWRTETISLFFRFFLNWEFFRSTFPRNSILQDISWKALLTVEAVVLPAILLLSWSQAFSSPYHYLYLSPVFAQYLSLAQAFLLLAPASVAWYYGVPLDRNMRGLGLGFGVFLSVSAINFGSLQFFSGFYPYARFLSPVASVGMIAVWLWAFWNSRALPGLSRTRPEPSEYRLSELAPPLDSQRQKRGVPT